MATSLTTFESGWLYGKNGTTGRYKFTGEILLNSQSITNNTSNITVNFYLVGDSNSGTTLWNASTTSNQPYGEITGDVQSTGARIKRYDKTTTPLLIAYWTGDIVHSSDGTKSLSVSCDWIAGGLNYYPATQTAGTMTTTLPTIARASSISVGAVTINSTTGSLSYTITSKANFYHKLTWSLGSASGTLLNAQNINATNYTGSIPYTTLLDALPSATTGTLRLTLTTYSNQAQTAQIGSVTATASASIDTNNIKPTITASASINSTPLSGVYVAGYSTAKMTYSVTRARGAVTNGTRVNFYISTGSMATSQVNNTLSGNVLSNTLPSSSSDYNATLTAIVTDSRGAMATTTAQITVKGYAEPNITATAYRCNQAGTADEAGAYVKATFSATVKALTGNSLQAINCTMNGTTINSGQVYALSESTAATFVVTARDKVATATKTLLVTVAKYPMDLYDDGNGTLGAAAGLVAEANKFKIGLPVYGTTNTVSYKHQITTSFKDAVAMGSYGTAQTTLEGFLNEVKFSNGATGSFSLNTAYTRDGITIPTGWYNFVFSPHRTGGMNGGANGDNTNYGNLLLMGMTGTRKIYKIRVSGGYVDEVLTSSTITDFSNAIAKGQTKYTGAITWGSWVTAQTDNELVRIGNVVQCRIRWKAAANTATNSPQIGTIPNGFKPVLQFYGLANVAWSNVQVPISISPNTGAMTHMNKVYAASANYILTATWLTTDDYPS